MGWIIWGVILPACVAAAWWIVRKPLRQVVEELHLDQARALFRQQREWLEARFLIALGKVDPIERLRWEDARWLDEVLWVRDSLTRRLLALVEVHFDPAPYDLAATARPQHATALFEYRKGRWIAEGRRIDDARPAEALVGHGRFEAVAPPPRRVRP